MVYTLGLFCVRQNFFLMSLFLLRSLLLVAKRGGAEKGDLINDDA